VPLFDIIKFPERAEQVVEPLDVVQEELITTSSANVSEVELLRALARQTDAQTEVERRYPTDARAEKFLSLCLDETRKACAKSYEHSPDVEDMPSALLRVMEVVVLSGEWPIVLDARESALATVAELSRHGFLHAMHMYRKVKNEWQLWIRFGL
jgi:hypothetical protein